MLDKTAEPILLELKAVRKEFPIYRGFFKRKVGALTALDGVDLSLARGEALGLVGESGCGKSTLGRIVLRLLPASSGSISLEGVDLLNCPPGKLKTLRRHMQMVFQNPYASLDPRMTVGESIAEPLLVQGICRGKEAQKEVKKLLELVGLAQSMYDRYPHEFSGGQRQRVGIARALALKPKLVVLDEPVSALDVSVQAQILNLLIDLRQEFNLSYLFIAHNLDVVRYISERIAVMYLGKIVETGFCERVYRKPLHPYSRALISAAPVPDPGFDRRSRLILEGELPSPANPPAGCRFHTRCPLVEEKCRREEPQLREIEAGHFSACHFAEKMHATDS